MSFKRPKEVLKKEFTTKQNVEWDSSKVTELLKEIIGLLSCQVQPTGCFISSGDLCGKEIFFLPKLQCEVYFNPATSKYEALPMGIQTTPYQPAQSKICASAQVAAYELLPGSTTVGAIVAAVLAATPLTFDVAGKAVAVTAEDVNFIKIQPKACETLTSTGDEVTIDYINVNGNAAGNFVDLEEGGVEASTAIEVPVGACAIVDVCFGKCWSKQEVSAL